MKKVLLTGAALMLAGGMVSTASAAAVEPGVKITGDARVRLWYMSEEYAARGNFGNSANDWDADTTMDSRIRLNIQGTAAGGAYAKARIRMYETIMGDFDKDATDGAVSSSTSGNSNIWVDQAYVGIPFNDAFTLEIGKWRSTYGPLPSTYNFFYDDVHLTGFRGIIKMNDIEINPFMEWMEEAQNEEYKNASDKTDYWQDNDEIRFGVHAKAKLNKDWTIGGMLGYQSDSREETLANGFEANEGFFASLYTNGKSGQFGIVGEIAVTDNDLNGMNTWFEDSVSTDYIGSEDTGFGGYIFPNYQIDKLNVGLNLGFTSNGFSPDNTFGFVMIGGNDNSKITAYNIGKGGDWMWGGLVASYQINESLKLTGNIVYAEIDAWDVTTEDEGPVGAWAGSSNSQALDSAWELSAVLQYTISKGADVYFSAGYMSPEFEDADMEDDGAFGALTRFELKF